jgi:hypothetical protein
MEGSNAWWLMGGFNVWWPLEGEGEKEAPFHHFFH